MGNLDDVTRVYKNKIIHWKGDGVYVHLTNAPLDWMNGLYRIEGEATIIYNLKLKHEVLYIREEELEDAHD